MDDDESESNETFSSADLKCCNMQSKDCSVSLMTFSWLESREPSLRSKIHRDLVVIIVHRVITKSEVRVG